MKKVFYFLFLFTLLSTTVYSQFDIWQTVTTSVGRVYGMVIDPSNQNIIYVGGLDQGINKTTNGGDSWTQMNSGLLNIQVQAVAISQNNPQHLYAGTAAGTNGGIYRTTNGGTSWSLVNTGITESSISIQALMVHPNNPEIAWACVFDGVADAVNGLYKTTNGGANWFPITNGIGAIKNFLALAMSPSDPNIIFAGSSFMVTGSQGPSAIYKSTDGGANWFLSSTGLPSDVTEINPIRIIQVSTANPNVVIAGLFMNTVNGGFYLSTDAGATWTKKHNGLPTDIGTLIRSSVIRPLFDNQFYVGLDRTALTNIGVWVTTDGGENWSSFNGGTMLNTYSVRVLAFNSTGTHTLFAGVASAVGQGVYKYAFSFIPVELVSFKAEVHRNNVNLSWITASEINNYGFEVERLAEGSSAWQKIGFVPGNGTTTITQYYSFTDPSVKAGLYSYRLKQMDFDGSFEYSDIVNVNVLPVSDFVLMQNYPNPFNPSTKISFNLPENGFTSLKVYSVIGSEVAVLFEEQMEAGSYEIDFNAYDLPSGVYYYTLKSGSYLETRKMILLR
jgi:photosystem II stability/assembly factor-like uncharacterized protein